MVFLVNYLVYSKILVSKKKAHILAKLTLPSVWCLVLFAYVFSIHLLFLIPIAVFIMATIGVGIGYGLLLWRDVRNKPRIFLDNILMLVLLFFTISLSSLLIAFWHWPVAVVMLVVWLLMFFIGLVWLLDFTNSPQLLSGVWALMCVEIFWICSRWVYLYQLPRTSLLVSQAAIVICALAYGFGGIYYHYKNKSLKKSLIFEYISVTTVIFVALMLLSKWAVAL